MPGKAVKDLPISRKLVDLYLINHPDGEGLEDWARYLYKGIRWSKSKVLYRLAKHIPKARKDLMGTTIPFILMEGAAAIYKLTTQGWGEKEAFGRVRNLVAPGDDPDNVADELWSWYEAHKRLETDKDYQQKLTAIFEPVREAALKGSKSELMEKREEAHRKFMALQEEGKCLDNP